LLGHEACVGGPGIGGREGWFLYHPAHLRQLTAYVAGVLLASADGARWSIEATDQGATETVCRHGQVIAHYVSETGLAGSGADLSPMAVAARW
jgi:hypothetical protein